MISLDIEPIEWEYENPRKLVGRKVVDLEEAILSCLLQKPELVNKLIVDEDDFNKYPKQFKFFRNFYDKFGNLDLVLMANKIRFEDRHRLIDVVDKLIDFEPSPSCFRLYQEALLEYNKECQKEILENKAKEKIIKKIVELNDKNESLESWFEEIQKIKEEIKNDL